MGNIKLTIGIAIVGIIVILSCNDEVVISPAVFDETPYNLEYGSLPTPNLPLDNPLTVQGVELGKMLFYEKMLSKDLSQSCASCHSQQDGFSDTLQFSIGVEQLTGRRQAMAIFNMAWHTNAFFWDGRATTLREQSLMPIVDPLEMNETLDNVVGKLSDSKIYRDQFTRAFGSDEVTEVKLSLALEQFMLSIVSYNSKYDQYLAGTASFNESEERGRILFEADFEANAPSLSGANCLHCHRGANFENDQYMNNGLDLTEEFTDLGREEVTGNVFERARFKVPSLRNIAITPPYMHDGRFTTLEEVVDHYDHGVKSSTTTANALNHIKSNGGLGLTEQDKVDLINFLHTLTDQTLVNNQAYRNPF